MDSDEEMIMKYPGSGKIPGRREAAKFLVMAVAGLLAGLAPFVRAEVTPEPERSRRTEWWREAKFGMFIHWGGMRYLRSSGKARRRTITASGLCTRPG